MAKHHKWRVRKEHDRYKLEKFLADRPELQTWSRRAIRRSLDRGEVSINGKVHRHAGDPVRQGQEVELHCFTQSATPDIKIIYENKDFIAVHKPAGVLSQPTTKQPAGHITQLVQKVTASKQLCLCHRLDAETSGLILLAKNQATAEAIFQLFATRQIQKTYTAFVFGHPHHPQWCTEARLSRFDPKTQQVQILQKGPGNSKTLFELDKYYPHWNVSKLKCFPHTGKTHQIRVHLSSVGMPILGDKIYSRHRPKSWPLAMLQILSSQHFLHAERLQFKLAGKAYNLYCPEPDTFASLQRHLHQASSQR
ncbi:MAG: RluA family pseudouridine synthase [Zetaproteobacteria bacterium]|nr:RluA family pseudouridine synthase [Zetaproteobacteria bacterium]